MTTDQGSRAARLIRLDKSGRLATPSAREPRHRPLAAGAAGRDGLAYIRYKVGSCPRCGGKLFRDSDPAYVWCINHGSVFVGTTLPWLGTGRQPYHVVGSKVDAEDIAAALQGARS